MRHKRLIRRGTLLALAFCAPLLFACGGGPRPDASNASNAPASNSSAAATPAAAATPKKQEVTATVEEATLDAGGAGEVKITLDIAEGYHVHSNPASDKFYIPTEVKAEPQEGLTPGRPSYPKPSTHKFEFSDKPLSVYEGQAVIRMPIRADKSAAKGRHTLNASIRVQPCNDQVCLPPRNIAAAVPVVVN
jgi:DsbC/DsbD-like thiol-disulfide interchange protein